MKKSQSINDILVQENYVSASDIQKAEEFARTHHTTVVDYLQSAGLLTKDLLGQAMAESFSVPYADLSTNAPPHDQVLTIAEPLAKQYRVVLFAKNKSGATVCTDNPDQPQLLAELKKIFGTTKVTIAYSFPEVIDVTFDHYR